MSASRWWTSRAVLAISVALLTEACSMSPTASPSAGSETSAPSAAGSATPSAPAVAKAPSSDSVAEVLLSTLQRGFTGRLLINGTERAPSSISMQGPSGEPLPLPSLEPLGDVVIHYAGEVYLKGPDYLVRVHDRDSGQTYWSELHIGTDTWRRDVGASTWSELSGDEAAHPRLPAVLAGLTSLQALGPTQIDGRALLAFQAPSSTQLDLVTFFETPTALKHPDTGSLILYTTSDGTLSRIRIQLTSDDFDYSEVMPSGMSGPARQYDLTFTVEAGFAPATLPEPYESTKRVRSSAYGLSMNLPQAMEANPAKKDYAEYVDHRSPGVILRFGREEISASEAADQQKALLDAAQSTVGDMANDGYVLQSADRIEIDGKPAYMYAMALSTSDPSPALHLEMDVVSGRHVYWVNWHSFHTPGDGDLLDFYRFERILESVGLD
jgi:hypothetical protein